MIMDIALKILGLALILPMVSAENNCTGGMYKNCFSSHISNCCNTSCSNETVMICGSTLSMNTTLYVKCPATTTPIPTKTPNIPTTNVSPLDGVLAITFGILFFITLVCLIILGVLYRRKDASLRINTNGNPAENAGVVNTAATESLQRESAMNELKSTNAQHDQEDSESRYVQTPRLMPLKPPILRRNESRSMQERSDDPDYLSLTSSQPHLMPLKHPNLRRDESDDPDYLSLTSSQPHIHPPMPPNLRRKEAPTNQKGAGDPHYVSFIGPPVGSSTQHIKPPTPPNLKKKKEQQKSLAAAAGVGDDGEDNYLAMDQTDDKGDGGDIYENYGEKEGDGVYGNVDDHYINT